MRLNEFYSDRYVAVFASHNFRIFCIKDGDSDLNPKFSPRPYSARFPNLNAIRES